MPLLLPIVQDITVYICLLSILVLLLFYRKTRDKDLIYFTLAGTFYLLGEVCFDTTTGFDNIPIDFIFFSPFYLFLFLFLKRRTKNLLKNPDRIKNIRMKIWTLIAVEYCIVAVISYLLFDYFDRILPDIAFHLPPMNFAMFSNYLYTVLDFLLFGYYTIVYQTYIVSERKAYLAICAGAFICTAGDFIVAYEETYRVTTYLYGDDFQLLGLIILIITLIYLKSCKTDSYYTTIDLERRQTKDSDHILILNSAILFYLLIYVYCIKKYNTPDMMTAVQAAGVFLLILAAIRQNIIHIDMQNKLNTMSKDAYTDPLTGFYTRKYTYTLMKSLYKSSCCFHHSFSVIMLDIDYYKKFNDTYGHICGDYALKEIAQLISDSIDIFNIVCRYGGEEFLIVLPGIDLTEGMLIAEKIRRNVAAYEFQNGMMKVEARITVSIGGATADNTLPNELKLIERADKALYRAKIVRNTCAWYSKEDEGQQICSG